LLNIRVFITNISMHEARNIYTFNIFRHLRHGDRLPSAATQMTREKEGRGKQMREYQDRDIIKSG